MCPAAPDPRPAAVAADCAHADGGGGQVVAVGTPEQVAAHPTSYTGAYLAKVPGIVPEEVKTLEVVGAEKVKKRPSVSSANLDKKPRKKATAV